MAFAFLASITSAATKPNIVYILCGDLGYGDVQALNPERGKIRMPNIDRLNREGMIFTDAHSSSSVCSPTRYDILTGRYNWRSRLQKGVLQGEAAARGAKMPPLQLFDLKDDPAETANVAADHSDVAKRLQALLQRYIDEGRSAPGAPQKNDVAIEIDKPPAATQAGTAEGQRE